MNLRRSKGLVTKFIPIACVTWLLFLVMAFQNTVRAEEKILIAAAANLNPAMNDIIKGFKKEYPTIDAEVSYGSSGNFFAQIKQGAPFDIFFSADTTYPARLEDEGLAVKGESKIYAFGSIVLWIPRSSSLNPRKGLHLVSDNKVKKAGYCKSKTCALWYGGRGGASILWIVGQSSGQAGLRGKYLANGAIRPVRRSRCGNYCPIPGNFTKIGK